MIAIIDYGMGNLRSVQKALQFVGQDAVITSDLDEINKADKIVLPGVGAIGDAMETIRKKGFDKAIYKACDEGKPFLGICLGMQMVFDKSYEYGEHKGLGLIPGTIQLLPDNVKKPHIGWNNLNVKMRAPLFENTGEVLTFTLFTLIILKQMLLLFLLLLFMAKKFRLLFRKIIFSLYSSTQKRVEM